ncbi:MAG TPA: BON domain-containing protein [Nitrospiraceae bacterium]|jgi:hypothetical protein
MKLVEAGAFPKAMVGDEAVLETLEEWYSRRPSLADVQISVWEGVAILRGRVTTLRDRHLAIELALDAGADEVVDELTLTWPVAA